MKFSVLKESELPKKYISNIPPKSKDSILKHADSVIEEVITSLPRSAEMGDTHAFRNQCSLLEDYCRVGHPIPFEVNKNISLLLFDSLVANHRFPKLSLDIGTQIRAMKLLCLLLKKWKKSSAVDSVVFPWRPWYLKLRESFEDGPFSPSCMNGGKAFTSYSSSLLRTSKKIRPFFDSDGVDELIQILLSELSPTSDSFYETQILIAYLFPVDSSHIINMWFHKILSSIDWINHNLSSVAIFAELFAVAAKKSSIFNLKRSSNSEFNSHWLECITIFSQIFLYHLQLKIIPSQKSIGHSRRLWPRHFDNIVFSRNPLDSFSKSLAQIIVYSIDLTQNSVEVFSVLKNICTTVKNFYHPSNEGPWSSALSIFLCELSRMYLKRIGNVKTQGVGVEADVSIAKLLLPLAYQGLYSKSKQNRYHMTLTFKYLGRLFPSFVFDKLMQEILPALDAESSILVHRTISAVECLAEVAPVFFSRFINQGGAQYLEHILWSTLSSIDANDLMRTASTFVLYHALFTTIPFYSHDSRSSISEKKAFEFEDDARRVTFIFEEWSVAFIGKVLAFISTLDQHEKSNPLDQLTKLFLFKVLISFFFAISSDIRVTVLQIVMNTIKNAIENKTRKYFGVLIRAIGISCSQDDFLKVSTMVYEWMINGNSEISQQWFLYLLSQLCRNAGESIPAAVHTLTSAVHFGFQSEDRKVRKMARKLTRNILMALLSSYPIDYSPLPQSVLEKSEDLWNTWGGFAELCEDADNFEMIWYEPNDVTVNVAQCFIQGLLDQYFFSNNIFEHMPDPETLSRLLLLLDSIMEGATLFSGDLERAIGSDTCCSNEDEKSHFQILRFRSLNFVLNARKLSLRQWVLEVVARVFQLLNHDVQNNVDRTELLLLANRLAHSAFGKCCLEEINTHSLGDGHSIFFNSAREYVGNFKVINRPLLINRAKAYQDLRMIFGGQSLSWCNVVPTYIDTFLKYAVSFDPNLRRSARKVLLRLIRLSTHCVPQISSFIFGIIESETSEEFELLGALDLLSASELRIEIMRSWDLFYRFVCAFCRAGIHKGDVFQSSIHRVFTDYVSYSYMRTLAHGSSDFETYTKLVEFLSKTLSEFHQGKLHWRYAMMASIFLFFNIRNEVEIPLSCFSIVTQGLLNNLGPFRRLSMVLAASITYRKMKSYLPPSFNVSNNTSNVMQVSKLEVDEIITHHPVDLGIKLESNGNGWNGESFNYRVPQMKAPFCFDDQLREFADSFTSFFCSNIETIVFALVEDHSSLESSTVKQNKDTTGTSTSILNLIPSYFRTPFKLALFGLESEAFDGFHVTFIDLVLTLSKKAFPLLLNEAVKLTSEFENHESVLAGVEILASLVRSSMTNQEYRPLIVDVFRSNFSSWIERCSLNALDAWCTSFRYMLNKVDLREAHWFLSELLESQFSYEILRKSSPLGQFRRLRLLHPFMIELSWRGTLLNQFVMDLLSCDNFYFLRSDFHQVRIEVAYSIADLLKSFFRVDPVASFGMESFSPREHPAKLSRLLDVLSSSENLASSDAFLETFLLSLESALQFGYMQEIYHLVFPGIEPSLMTTKHSKIELAKLAKSCSGMIGASLVPKYLTENFLMKWMHVLDSSSWKARVEVLKVFQLWFFQHSIYFGTKEILLIQKALIKCLEDSRFEVQEIASVALSRLIMSCNTRIDLESLKTKFMKYARVKPSTPERAARRQSGVLGLAAMIYSEPFDITPWLPSTVAYLAGFIFEPEPISKIAKKAISEFKRSHQDNWHVFKALCTIEEIDSIDAANTAPTYFA